MKLFNSWLALLGYSQYFIGLQSHNFSFFFIVNLFSTVLGFRISHFFGVRVKIAGFHDLCNNLLV